MIVYNKNLDGGQGRRVHAPILPSCAMVTDGIWMEKLGKVGMTKPPLRWTGALDSWELSACYESVAAAADVNHLDGSRRVAFDCLAYIVDVPFGQLLRFAYIRLVAL